MAVLARKTILKRFDWSLIVKKVLAVYYEALS